MRDASLPRPAATRTLSARAARGEAIPQRRMKEAGQQRRVRLQAAAVARRALARQTPSSRAATSSAALASTDGTTTRTRGRGRRGSAGLELRLPTLHVGLGVQLGDQWPLRARALRAPIRPRATPLRRFVRRAPSRSATDGSRSAHAAAPRCWPCRRDVAAPFIAQHVRRLYDREPCGNLVRRAPPIVAAILDHQGLRDEPPGELGRRVANTQHLGGEPLMIRRATHSAIRASSRSLVSISFAPRAKPEARQECYYNLAMPRAKRHRTQS